MGIGFKKGADSALFALISLRGLILRTLRMEVNFRPVNSSLLGRARRVGTRVYPRIRERWCVMVMRKRRRKCITEWHSLAMQALRTGKPAVRVCHAGLRQFAIPLSVAGKKAGLLLSLTAIPSSEGGGYHNALRKVRGIKCGRGEWNRGYHAITAMNKDTAMNALQLCAGIAESVLHMASSEDSSGKGGGLHNEILSRLADDDPVPERRPDDFLIEHHKGQEHAINSAGMKGIAEYLANNYSRRLSRLEISRQAGCSPQSLSRKFKKENGASIPVFLNRIRLEHARNLLVRSAMSVATVARDCGFSTRRNFYSAFRKETGRTPLDFRRNPGLNGMK